MLPLACRVDQAVAKIRDHWPRRPAAGIVLGTGLGCLARQVETAATIPFEQIPHFPRATVESHEGRLVCGWLAGVPVATMDGRLHCYEGYSVAAVTFPIRVLARLGARLLIVSNASGGMDPRYRLGDILVITDHINLMAANPLKSAVGGAPRTSRQPAGGYAYDRVLVERALEIARREGFVAHRGTYVGVRGPNYETRAEYRFLRRIGGDVVGMSTVPEVLVAGRLGLRVLALSTITNVCLPAALHPTRSADVVAAAANAETNIRKIVTGILADQVLDRYIDQMPAVRAGTERSSDATRES